MRAIHKLQNKKKVRLRYCFSPPFYPPPPPKGGTPSLRSQLIEDKKKAIYIRIKS